MHRASLASFTAAYFEHTTLQYIELYYNNLIMQHPCKATLSITNGSDKGIYKLIQSGLQSPSGVSALVLCETQQFCFGQGGVKD